MISQNTVLLATGKIAPWLGPQEGFVLSQLMEPMSYAELSVVVPMPAPELNAMVQRMYDEGIVSDLKKGTIGAVQAPAQKKASPSQHKVPVGRVESYVRKLELQEKASADEDIYKTLGVQKGTDKERIENAFHRLSLAFHPDKIPAELRADLSFVERTEKIWSSLRVAYDILTDDTKRRAWARAQRDKKVGTRPNEPISPDTEVKGPNRDGLKIETLLKVVKDEYAKLETSSALRSLQLARRIDPANKELSSLQDEIENCHKILNVLDRTALAGIMSDYERKKVARVLSDQKESILHHPQLMSRVFQFLVAQDIDPVMARELYHRFPSGTMTEDEMVSSIELFAKLQIVSTAGELVAKAAKLFPGNDRIKDLHKIIRKMKR